jgi:hypothetical protein
VGALTGLVRFGEHDWYADGARQLLREQRADGAWIADGRPPWPPTGLMVADTCFALLFLRKATLTAEKPGRETLYRSEAAAAEVHVRVDAKSVWTLWITGFGSALLTADPVTGAARGPSIERVEWWIDGALVETLLGDPARPWTDESFALRYEPVQSGALVVECRVTVRGPNGGTRELRAQPLSVPSEFVLEPWMLEYTGDDARNAFRGYELELVASSEASKFHSKDDLVDGLQGSAWLAAQDDAEPWIRIEIRGGARLKELVLSQAAASEHLLGECVLLASVELRVNDAKTPQVVALEPDYRLKTRIALAKPTLVREIELRIVAPPRVPGKYVGFAELEAR